MRRFFHYAAACAPEGRVTKELVIRYKKELQKTYAVASVNSMLASLNHFFKYMGWYDCVVKSLKVQKNTFRAGERELTKEEYFRLLETARQKKNERLSCQREQFGRQKQQARRMLTGVPSVFLCR